MTNEQMVGKPSVHRILVIKLRAIGDVLLSTAVLRSLRDAYPSAQLDFLTELPGRDAVEGHPCVDNVVAFDPKRQSGWSLIRDIRKRRYDLVLDLFGNPRSAIITFASRARYRVGYRFKWRQYCYNTVVEPRGGEVHNREFNLDALSAIGVPVSDATIQFPLTEEAERFADDFFRRQGLGTSFVVALNPGGGWYTKRWRVRQYAALADRIARHDQARVIILWGPSERSEAEQLQASMTEKADLIPATNLKQLGAILKRCSVLITNDSGPMHIGAALQTPIVAIFGPTNPELQGPVGTRHEIVQNQKLLCLGCNFTTCPIGNPCMEELAVDDVYGSFHLLMNKVRARAEETI